MARNCTAVVPFYRAVLFDVISMSFDLLSGTCSISAILETLTKTKLHA